MTINDQATRYLNSLPQITDYASMASTPCVLCPHHSSFAFSTDGKLYLKTTSGYENQKELIEIIRIEDALSGKYSKTGIFVPRLFAEKADVIPTHLTTQCIIISNPKSPEDVNRINLLLNKYKYINAQQTNLWIGEKKVQINDPLIIMNRRIGGWDGSKDRPVVELLGAGGHVPCVWNGSCFSSIDSLHNLVKEFSEELKLDTELSQFTFVGGFHNQVSQELVLLYIMHLEVSEIELVQKNAIHNIAENIDGIFIGNFEEVISIYLKDASMFAGGEKAKETNFPSQKLLLGKVRDVLYSS